MSGPFSIRLESKYFEIELKTRGYKIYINEGVAREEFNSWKSTNEPRIKRFKEKYEDFFENLNPEYKKLIHRFDDEHHRLEEYQWRNDITIEYYVKHKIPSVIYFKLSLDDYREDLIISILFYLIPDKATLVKFKEMLASIVEEISS